MRHVYRLMCVAMVLVLALGLAVTVGAQGPVSNGGSEPVPPRPDLPYLLQASPEGRSLNLSGADAGLAYSEYLASKLAPNADAKAVGTMALPAPPGPPPVARIVIALVDFDDLGHNEIPKPDPENNTDFWVSDFDLDHYATMAFEPENPWSLRNYFREASYWGTVTGQDFPGDVHDWTAVDELAAEYGDDHPDGGVDNDDADGEDLETFVMDAANTLDGWVPDGGWSLYTDGAGVIEYFIIVHAGRGQEAGGGALGDDALWSTHGSLGDTYSIPNTEVDVLNYVVVPEDVPVGLLVHEMGRLFGLPDTWNRYSGVGQQYEQHNGEAPWPYKDLGGAGEASPAFYDPMAQGFWLGRPLGTKPASMTAWERMQLEWLVDPVVWDPSMMPASVHLDELETPSPDNQVIKIEMPERVYVEPHSGDKMRGAPMWDNLISPSNLKHTFEITGVVSAELRFWHWYDIEPTADIGLFQVDVDGGAVEFTDVISYTGNSGGWVMDTIDLSAYLGQTINTRFRLERDETIEGLGWYLDDFELIQDGIVTWEDDLEGTFGGPPQNGGYTWTYNAFPPRGPLTSEHYFLAEWRNDDAGFDRGLQEVYNMTDMVTGKAEYFQYNPGLLVWYVNPIYWYFDPEYYETAAPDKLEGVGLSWEIFPDGHEADNNVLFHPGEGFILAVDSHPDALIEGSSGVPGIPWRTRVQMLDATFRRNPDDPYTYDNEISDTGGVLNAIGGLPENPVFWDKHASYPYWDPDAPYNSVKTPGLGIKMEVEGENSLKDGATIHVSVDAANMRESTKSVDKDFAYPDDILEYTIVLINSGWADAYSIVVEDEAPVGTTYLGITSIEGSPDYVLTENNGIHWMGTVLLGQPVTITFEVVIDGVLESNNLVNLARVYEGAQWEVDLYAETYVDTGPCFELSSKHVEPSQVLAGDVLTYTIELLNSGRMDATATVTDCIPQCTTYVPGSLRYEDRSGDPIGEGSYDADTDCITWTGPVTVTSTTEPEATVWITFQVRVDSGEEVCTGIFNTAIVDDGCEDEWPLVASASVIAGPNLKNSYKSVDKDVAQPGDELTYTIVVSNHGNRPALGVELVDEIPPYTTYVSPSLSCDLGECGFDVGTQVITWTGDLLPLDEATIVFTVEADAPLDDGTWITNTALINWENVELERKADTEIFSAPRLTSSTKEWYKADNEPSGFGGILSYVITLVNDGTMDATVGLHDPIPAGTEYVVDSLSYTPSYSAWYNDVPPYVAGNGPVPAGESVTVTYDVEIMIEGTGIITNTALINDNVNPRFSITTTTYVASVEVVEPEEDVACGDELVIPIRIENAYDLQGFEIVVNFDPNYLTGELIEVGSWFSPAAWEVKYWDNEAGEATIAAALYTQPMGLIGDGDLFYLHFRTHDAGTTDVSIDWSLLSNTPGPAFQAIPHNVISPIQVMIQPRTISGQIEMQGRGDPGPVDHSGVELWLDGVKSDFTTDGEGYYEFCPPVGTGEMFVLRAVKDGYLYGEKTITVDEGDTNVTYLLLLGGDPIGESIVVNVTDPPCDPGQVSAPTVPGPPDDEVDILDLTFVGNKFGKDPGASDWGPDPCEPEWLAYRADINEDLIVNIFDLVLVGNNFGSVAPSDWP